MTWELELEDTFQIAEVCSEIMLIATIQSDLDLVTSYAMKFTNLLKDEKQIPMRLQGFLAYEMTKNKRKSSQGFELLDACIEELPNLYELYLLRALTNHFAGNHQTALIDLERADQLSKDNIFVISMIGDCHYYMNTYLAAEQAHKQALKLNPFFRRSLICMGLILMETHRSLEASEYFLRMIGPEPMNWFSHGCLGDILFESKGNSLHSLPYYAAAIISGHVHVATCFNLSSGFIALGKYQEAYRVLSLCNDRDLKYNKQSDLSTVHYVQLALDIAIHPEKFNRNMITHVSSKLKQRHFKILQSLLLLHFEIQSIDFLAPNEKLLEHFAQIIPTTETEVDNAIGVSSYELIIKNYLENKKQRTASQEELLLIVMIARGLLWGGLIYEAKLLVTLLLKSQDAYASDAGEILLQELYEHEAASRRAGIEKQEIYEFFIQKGLPKSTYSLDHKARLTQITQEKEQQIASAVKQSANYDFAQNLFDFHFTEQCQAALDENNTQELRQELASRYFEKWSLQKTNATALNNGKGSAENTNHQGDEKKEDPAIQVENASSTSRFLNELVANYDADMLLNEVEKCNAHQLLQALIDQSDDELLQELKDIDWKACNDDSADYGDNSDQELGEGPLLFATEGSAFRRHLPTIECTLLNPETVTELFQALLDLPIREEMLRRPIANCPPTSKAQAFIAALTQAVRRRCEEMWRNLHGQELPVSTDGLVDDIALAVLDKISLNHPVLIFYRHLIEHYPKLSPSFPASPLIANSLLYQKQQVPAHPKSTGILKQMQPCNRLTYQDLVESFFNRAVVAIEDYLVKDDPETLKVFFEPKTAFEWLGMDGKTRLETSQALAKEISQYLASPQTSTPIIGLRFGLGYKNNPFAQQFAKWAQVQAKHILPICVKLENDIRNNGSQHDFMLFLRAQELIENYPYLSKLYLVAAGLYVRADKKEQVLKLIKKGLEWENRLYNGTSHWQALDPKNQGLDEPIKYQYCLTEIGESTALWAENLNESTNESLIYHYIDIEEYFKMRRRAMPEVPALIVRENFTDKGGCYEFYMLFKEYILNETEIYDAFADCLITEGVYSLQDVITHCLKVFTDPYIFPFRHQLAEFLHQIYPKTDHTALARFYSENMQPVNSFIHAAYSYFANPHPKGEDPDNTAMNLGCVLYDLGYLNEAIDYLDEAIEMPKAASMAYLTRGCVAIEIGEFENAIEILKTGIENDPKSDRFYYNIALAQIELKRYDDAEASLKAGLALTDFALDIESQLMRLYIKAERYLDAISAAKRLEAKNKSFFLESIDNPEFTEFRKLKAIQELINR